MLNKIATPVVDGLTLVAYYFLLPFLTARFHAQDISNLVLVIGGYLLLCAGILVCKLLEPVEENKPGCALVLWLAWPYAIFVIVMLFESSGALTTGSSASERLSELTSGGPLGTILLVLVFLIVLLLFPLLVLVKPRPRYNYGSPAHTWLRIFGVAAVNFMALVTVAYWEWQLADAEPMEMALGGKLLVFLLAYAVFLMFYAPPRLALINLEPGRWTFVGYAVMLGYTVWHFMG